jgi:SAM-dependent methyltransferase
MLAVAAEKTTQVGDNGAQLDFLQADASDHIFERGSFDLLFSRFGVMFFDDPVGAFKNLRSALADDGRLAFCCWQPLRDNDWTRIPLQAALQHVEMPEVPDPNAPGPFAFANPERVRGILSESGFGNIRIDSHVRDIRFGAAPSLSESVRELAMIGPVSRLIAGQENEVMEKVFASMEEVLAPFFQDGALLLPGAIWFVTAEAA